MKKSTKVAVAVLAGLVSLSACGGSSGTAGSKGSAAASSKTLTIGLLSSLTGKGSSFGIPFKNGVELALRDVASSGALKDANVTLKLDTVDDGSDPATAVTAFNKFVQAGDQITLNAALTPIAKAVAPIANSDKVLFISGAGSPLPNDNGYAFHTADLGTPMKTLGEKVQADGGKRVAAIIDGSNPSFATLAGAFEKAVKGAGGSGFVASQNIGPNDSDFSSILTKLRGSKPDTILISALPQQSGNIIRQIKQFGGLDAAKIVGTVAWGPQVYDVAKDAAVGATFAAIWAPGAANSTSFETEYQSAYNSAPVAYSALGYTTGWTIAAAIQAVAGSNGKITSEALKGALPAASTSSLVQQHGVIADFKIDPSGSASYPGALAVFQPGGGIKAAA